MLPENGKPIAVVLTTSPHFGGSLQYERAVVEGLLRGPLGPCIQVAYSDPYWRGALHGLGEEIAPLPRWMSHGLACIPGLGAISRLILGWTAMGRWIRSQAPVLALFPSQDFCGYAFGLPTVGVIHDLMHRYESRFPEMGTWYVRLRREFHFRRMVRESNRVLVDSEVGRTHAVESYRAPHGRFAVLPYLPPDYIFEEACWREPLKPLPKKYFFYPAQFWAHKNHEVLLRATARLRDECPDMAWVFVGSQSHRCPLLQKLAVELGIQARVHFPGRVSDEEMPAYYRKARALVMASAGGPTNIPPLEAFHLGCPVAMSDVYGAREQARDAALFFDPNSIEDVASTLSRLWNNDEICRLLVEQGRERANTWDRGAFTQTLTSILKQVLEEGE